MSCAVTLVLSLVLSRVDEGLRSRRVASVLEDAIEVEVGVGSLGLALVWWRVIALLATLRWHGGSVCRMCGCRLVLVWWRCTGSVVVVLSLRLACHVCAESFLASGTALSFSVCLCLSNKRTELFLSCRIHSGWLVGTDTEHLLQMTGWLRSLLVEFEST